MCSFASSSTKLFLGIFVILISFQSCKKDEIEIQGNPTSYNKVGNATDYNASIAIQWMNVFRNIVKIQGINPPRASRLYAYASIALYESVVTGMPNNKSLKNQLNNFTVIPDNEYPELDYELVLNDAMYVVAKGILPNLSGASNSLIESTRQTILDSKRNQVAASVLDNSIDRGRVVGTAILNYSNTDNANTIVNLTYTVPSRAGHPEYWEPTGAIVNPLEPYWGTVRTFTMPTANHCFIASQIPFSIETNSEFYAQALEVLTVSQMLNQEQRNIALWWADGAGTATPPGHWLNIINQIISNENMNLAAAAEVYAYCNIGMAEAFISCWESKYSVNLLRPQTYIKQYISGNSDWSPYISTPPFPEYSSGHSVCSGAIAAILTQIFGDNYSFIDNTNTSIELSDRSFASFNAAAQEAAISRLYGGIHYREAIENGIEQGKLVSQSVFNKIHLNN